VKANYKHISLKFNRSEKANYEMSGQRNQKEKMSEIVSYEISSEWVRKTRGHGDNNDQQLQQRPATKPKTISNYKGNSLNENYKTAA
jgi:hypothetical protein